LNPFTIVNRTPTPHSIKEYVNSIKSEATGNFNLIEIMEEKKMKKLNKLIK